MQRRSLLATTMAALALTVTAGLTVTGCGSGRMAALHGNCKTKGLSWKVTVLKAAPHSAHREAKLSVVNKGSQPCVFDGFPTFAVHVGKGPESDGKGQGRTMPIDLRRGGMVTTHLRYKDHGPGMTPADCLVSNDEAIVGAPRDRHQKLIKVRDEKGKKTRMNICEQTIWMGPPIEQNG
ncbi:DUF4232 domain-containing protein [Streptomyces noursei]|uniref:DUF4232 domain-containing protein n=1 Tax=Streptomyces noursei TaxID=1971 RepID=UPI00081CB4E4|nr:DUF4232 domain-containing protein [Streptomyces noursei]ANZ18402.1 Protein of unknown function (DUF4232) [Streptomyces noursei ATCC 11455]MCZ0995137.1 DUF4232 domain-containing protein [Streptomyces noursei]MCZ1016083.1 DUF4232 domain-containing protein [Streptomyces noursei]